MGCDIHAGVQGRHREQGRFWYDLALDLQMDRHYPLFAAMAGVRNYEEYGITPVCDARGLPSDIGESEGPYSTAALMEDLGTDGHSHSWLSFEEFRQAIQRASSCSAWGGAGIPSAEAVLEFMRRWENAGHETRIVFCFDN